MTTALVLGGAACVWDDVEAALELGEFSGVVACNDAAAVWPGPLDALVTLHPEKAGLWIKRRDLAGFEPPAAVYGHALKRDRRPERVTHTTGTDFPGQTSTGSSGLFAAKVALIDLRYDRAVLCGVPIEPAGGHFVRGEPWNAARSYRPGWNEAWPQIKDRLRSMSGWTAERLGRPTPDWISN